MPQGRLFVVAGPSGAGKGTLIAELLRGYSAAWLSISATTRKPRQGEVGGAQYHFLAEDEFRDKVAKGDFLEWAEVHGNLYGTPKKDVVDRLTGGYDVILEIDVQGARQVREKMPDAVSVFVLPPSVEVLEARLRSRATEDEGELQKRLRNALDESRERDDYQYVLINDLLYRAVEEFCAIYEKESPLQKGS
jgi:guanylate kinase